jgi:hypothetical protein
MHIAHAHANKGKRVSMNYPPSLATHKMQMFLANTNNQTQTLKWKERSINYFRRLRPLSSQTSKTSKTRIEFLDNKYKFELTREKCCTIAGTSRLVRLDLLPVLDELIYTLTSGVLADPEFDPFATTFSACPMRLSKSFSSYSDLDEIDDRFSLHHLLGLTQYLFCKNKINHFKYFIKTIEN